MLRPALALLCCFTAAQALASDSDSRLRDYAQTVIDQISSDPAVQSSIKAQNRRHAGFDQARIDTLDKNWRAQVGSSDTPMIDDLLSGVASEKLKRIKYLHGGEITEIFIMDNLGLNVGQSDVTSDYWQGDEAKFQETFGTGGAALHVGEIEFDPSTSAYQAQVSATILDRNDGRPIGAVTLGIDVSLLGL